MSTINTNESLSASLFGKTRRAVLALLYSHVDESFYLRQIVRTAGVGMGEILKAALVPLADLINVAFLFGSLVRGDERSLSDADVLVVGNVTFSEVVKALSQIQETIRREINPIVYPPKEFRSKLAADHHFLRTTLNSPKFFLIGDEHELAKLVE
jgi:predicted nucleotidyltransferase